MFKFLHHNIVIINVGKMFLSYAVYSSFLSVHKFFHTHLRVLEGVGGVFRDKNNILISKEFKNWQRLFASVWILLVSTSILALISTVMDQFEQTSVPVSYIQGGNRYFWYFPIYPYIKCGLSHQLPSKMAQIHILIYITL